MTTNYRTRDTRIRSGRPIRTIDAPRGASRSSAYPSRQSRDLSTSGSTALLVEASPVEKVMRPSRVPHRSRSTLSPDIPKPVVERRRLQRKPGSQQVFSNRGKRIVRQRVDPHRIRFVVTLTLVLGAGVFIAMMLSKISTEQSFEIQELQHNETTLQSQIETLNRDLQNASATAEIARQAKDMGMVIPDQPGILAKNESGDMSEQRAPGTVTRPIVDVNGQQIRPRVASSDPKATNEVSQRLNETPRITPQAPNVAPYISNRN